MDISYDYYRIFYYAAKYGNLSQAAKHLLSSQPNLTRTIRNLEAQLGCALFFRTNRGMKLTPEGEKLYAHVRIAFEQLEAGEAELMTRKNLHSGTICVAASEVALRCLLLPVLKSYRLRYPGIRIRIANHSTPQAIEALEAGIADLAVVTTPTVRSSVLTETMLMDIREAAVCSDSLKRLQGRTVPLAELLQHPIISLGRGTGSFDFYDAFFSSHGLPFQPDIEASTADQILPMVEADLGIGFVPRQFLPSHSDLTVIDLAEKIPQRHICMIEHKQRPLSLAAQELRRMIVTR